jgi:hypothetical protein
MTPNQKLTELVTLLGAYDPASVAAGTVTTGWISAANHGIISACIQTGVMGASATLDAKIQQATDNAGAGAKDVTGKALTQIVKASGDNKQAFINFRSEDLDVANGFSFFRLSMTVGTAACLISALIQGGDPRYAPASHAASVVQS